MHYHYDAPKGKFLLTNRAVENIERTQNKKTRRKYVYPRTHECFKYEDFSTAFYGHALRKKMDTGGWLQRNSEKESTEDTLIYRTNTSGLKYVFDKFKICF